MQAAKDKTYNIKFYMHITKKKKLIQRRHQSKKNETITIRATKIAKIDIVLCCCKNSIEKHFVGHKNSHQLQF